MRNLASLKTPKLIIHCVCDVETPGFVKVKKCNLPCGWFFKPPVKVDQTARWFIALITPSWLYSWCVDPHLSCVNLYANLVPLRTLWLRSEGQQQLSGNKSSFLLQLAESHHRATLWHGASIWQPTPVFLPRESQGWGSLVGCRLWGRTESDTTEVT